MLSLHERATAGNAWQSFAASARTHRRDPYPTTNTSLTIGNTVFSKQPRVLMTERASTRAWMWLTGQDLQPSGSSQSNTTCPTTNGNALHGRGHPQYEKVSTSTIRPNTTAAAVEEKDQDSFQPAGVSLRNAAEVPTGNRLRTLNQQRSQRKEEELERRSDRSPSTGTTTTVDDHSPPGGRHSHRQKQKPPMHPRVDPFLGLGSKLHNRRSFPHPLDHSVGERRRLEEMHFARLASALSAVTEAAPERFKGAELASFQEGLQLIEERAVTSEHAYHQIHGEETAHAAAEMGLWMEVLAYSKLLSDLSAVQQKHDEKVRRSGEMDDTHEGDPEVANALEYGLSIVASLKKEVALS